MSRISAFLSLALAAAVWVACEPTSITEARDQLGRGPARTVRLNVPIAQDTFRVAEFLPASDTTTTADGAVGLRFDADSVRVDLGTNLRFDNITFDAFTYSFNQMLQTTQQQATITFPAPPMVEGAAPPDIFPAPPPPTRFSTPSSGGTGGSTVVTATIASGYVVRSFTNGTGCSVTVNNSLTDSLGATVASFPSNVVVANGGTLLDSISAAGVTVSGYAQVAGSASTGACVPGNPAVSVGVTFRPLTLSSVTLANVNEGFTQNYNALASEARIQAVDTVMVATGTFSLTLENRLPITDTIRVQLNGITRNGAVVTGTLAVPAAPGNGTYTSGTLNLDLAGARILPGQVVAQVTGTAKASQASITSTNAAAAARVTGGGNLVIQSLSGPLNPASTPELNLTIENSDEFTRSQIDLGDLEDAVRQSSINYAALNLTIRNNTGIPMSMGLQIGVVQLDASGNLRRVAGGAPDYERDASGNVIRFGIYDPGASNMTIARNQTKAIAVNAAPLIDRMVDLLLDNRRVALVVAGGASAGDGAQSRITRTDFVRVQVGITIGLDITIPPSGVTFRRTQVAEGLDLDAGDADEFASRLVLATAGARVTNRTPFGVTVQVALVSDSLPSTTDVFALPACTGLPTRTCRVSLDSVVLRPSIVNPLGQVTTPSQDSVAVTISGLNSRVLFGRKLTAGVRIRFLPGTGGNGRGAFRPSDYLIVNARAAVDVRSGGAQ